MPEPIEAEFARPPIFTDAQETHLQHEARGDLHDDPDAYGSSTTTTAVPSVHNEKRQRDLETAEKFNIVTFEEGGGENPKEWSRGKKCAMPTGDLKGTAKTLHVSGEVINLSITLALAKNIGTMLVARLVSNEGSLEVNSILKQSY
ncbi:hypothetical protein QFC19_006238 [Naganishia cerealis]|uniref:Uncharacterized protein n=1 Tax=Naganishia cerealis TaxID=610337 RepID=A0ACC2VIA2_9TREE|nr:hypothetical protein QFC19_006238 [Naganishia cerealis]